MGIPLGVFEGEVGGGFTRFHGGKGGEVEGKRKEGDKEVIHPFTIPRNIGWSRGSHFSKRPQGLEPKMDAEACVPTGCSVVRDASFCRAPGFGAGLDAEACFWTQRPAFGRRGLRPYRALNPRFGAKKTESFS